MPDKDPTPETKPMPDFNDRAPRDRYCDLILTGGVTSAIAYPAAIATLATTYRFNSIGGSSSGAGAAALAAAAEYRRRHGSSDGFRVLIERTAAVANVTNNRTALHWFFQPAANSTRLFDVLVPLVAKPNVSKDTKDSKDSKGTKDAKDGKGWTLAKAVVSGYAQSLLPLFLLACLVSVILIGLNAWSHLAIVSDALRDAPQTLKCGVALAVVVGAVALALLVLFGAAAILLLVVGGRVWRDLAHVVEADFGLCSGYRREKGAPEPTLVEWLHNLIQEIAGRRPSEAPLTFADLAKAPGAPQETLGDLSRPGNQSIRLQMFTANVTLGRPYLFPQEEGDTDLYFKPDEMAELFPASVIEHMKRGSAPRDGKYWVLPKQELPIVVAARMSVSFPVLFRAVPLWALDTDSNEMRRCLFLDGGLCSNFPIHLFDSPIPAWPTFGISLQKAPDVSADTPPPDLVSLPVNKCQGQSERWSDLDRRSSPGARLMGFAGAMFDTVIDWNDATLARLPGVWDRVVRVKLVPGIGGLNILMDEKQIAHLSELGGEAAKRLLERFVKPSDGANGLADGWNEHRWVRFNLLRECLAEALSGVSQSAGQRHFAQPMLDQIRGAVGTPSRHHEPPLLAAQAAELEGVLAALMQVERALNAPTGKPPFVIHPRPQLRVRPPL